MRVFILEDDEYRLQRITALLGTGCTFNYAMGAIHTDKFTPPYDLIILDCDIGEGGNSAEEFIRKIQFKVNPDATILLHAREHTTVFNAGEILWTDDNHAQLTPWSTRDIKRMVSDIKERVRYGVRNHENRP